MTPPWLIDTNIVSYFIRRSPLHLFARIAATPREELAVSVVTAMELRYGVAKNPGARKNAEEVERFLVAIPTIPLPDNIDRVYADVRADLERRGKPIGPLDTVIAAHALAIGATLVTNNLREFRRVTGLACEDWSVARR